MPTSHLSYLGESRWLNAEAVLRPDSKRCAKVAIKFILAPRVEINFSGSSNENPSKMNALHRGMCSNRCMWQYVNRSLARGKVAKVRTSLTRRYKQIPSRTVICILAPRVEIFSRPQNENPRQDQWRSKTGLISTKVKL